MFLYRSFDCNLTLVSYARVGFCGPSVCETFFTSLYKNIILWSMEYLNLYKSQSLTFIDRRRNKKKEGKVLIQLRLYYQMGSKTTCRIGVVSSRPRDHVERSHQAVGRVTRCWRHLDKVGGKMANLLRFDMRFLSPERWRLLKYKVMYLIHLIILLEILFINLLIIYIVYILTIIIWIYASRYNTIMNYD